MKNILITGGCGFVGRSFVEYFLKKKNRVVVVDNIFPGTGAIDVKYGWPNFEPRDYSKFKFFKEDCRSWFLKNKNKKFDLVLHLAAIVGGRLVIENNPIAVAQDLSIDADFWQWAQNAKPKKILCFSSSAAYPISFQTKNSFKLLNENMIDFKDFIGFPDMSYGWSKLTCEYLAKLAYERKGLKSVCYRPFSGYGPTQDMSYPFPSIIKRALKIKRKERKFMVWGSGKQMRDFIHIDDCVRGVIKTMNKIDDGSAINLSTGKYTSFIDFAKITFNLLGHKRMEVVGSTNKPEGVFARGGCTKKQRKLGFSPNTTLKNGIKNSLNFISSKI